MNPTERDREARRQLPHRPLPGTYCCACCVRWDAARYDRTYNDARCEFWGHRSSPQDHCAGFDAIREVE
jgi:hypothetical protein